MTQNSAGTVSATTPARPADDTSPGRTTVAASGVPTTTAPGPTLAERVAAAVTAHPAVVPHLDRPFAAVVGALVAGERVGRDVSGMCGGVPVDITVAEVAVGPRGADVPVEIGV